MADTLIHRTTKELNIMAATATRIELEEPKFVRSSIVSAITWRLEEDIPPEFIGGWTRASELRVIATAADNTWPELYDSEFVPELVESFQWWIKTAECFLVYDEKGMPPEHWRYRDRLISLEGRFWEAVASARRRSAMYLGPTDEITDEPVFELVRRYLAYRDAVCAYAREVLPKTFGERLERRT